MQPKPHPLPLTDIQKKTLRHLDTATEMISNKLMEQIEKNKMLTANPFSSTAASSSLLGTPPPMKKSKRDGKRGSREGGKIDVVSVSFDVCFVYVYVGTGGYNEEGMGYLSLVIRSLNDIKCDVLYALVRQDIHVFKLLYNFNQKLFIYHTHMVLFYTLL